MGGLKSKFEPYNHFFKKTVNQATLQPSKDLIEARLTMKTYSAKLLLN
jgi:hypothetical protein